MATDGGPRFRLDLIIATLALLASASASIATVVQTRVVANQLSAAVWPYLSFNTTESPTEFGVALANDGLGPALIRNVTLRVDGRARTRWREAVGFLRTLAIARRPGAHPRRASLSVVGFGPGTVVRPGSALQLVRLETVTNGTQIWEAAHKRVALEVCYCSILQKCWRVTLASNEPPRDVDSCGPTGASLEY